MCMPCQDVTVSFPCGKGKVSGLKVLQKNHTAGFQVLGEVNANEKDTVEATRKLILAPYGLGKSTNMQHYNILKKQKNKPPALKT